MTSHNRLDNSLRWRAVGRLEAGQSQAEETRWLQVAPKWSLGYRIIPNQWYYHQEGRQKSLHSIDICSGPLFSTKRTTT
ncbi:hypothetical protein TNCV_307371 [Trichonephila clavipes]|nr:hypothetical protein TNCV_307371 [Trichonephila clavipes]